MVGAAAGARPGRRSSVKAGSPPPPWLPLDSLLNRAGSEAVVGLEPQRTWAVLAARREAWRATLAGAAAGAVALFLEDGFEFSAALLGAWSAGRTVVLPADATPATAAALRAQGVHLAGAFTGGMVSPALVEPVAVPTPRRMPDLPLVVFTSGSTGEPVAIEKPRRCLDRELAALERVFGPRVAGAAFLATVPHQHYYGLLFRTLMPLVAGRPVLGTQLKLPEEVARACALAGPSVLVSSPALLKRLAGSPTALETFAPVREHWRAVFSSGGPLPWDAVWRSQAALGQSPCEVFGSSETGGVAWRQRQNEDQPWLALPGVETSVEEGSFRLRVRAPHLAEDGWMATQDRATLVEGGFRLLGRADRVAKVEEKRVSLTALEKRLEAHPAVAEAKVLVLEGQREELAAVLRLRAGAAPVDLAQRRTLLAELRTGLAEAFEAVTQPRRWRLVDEWPADELGKVTQAALRGLFNQGPAPQEPTLLFVRRPVPGQVELGLLLPPSLHWFQGHFPGFPILPGVVQVHWAVAQAARELGLAGPWRGLQALKFQRPLRPGQSVTLGLKACPDGKAFDFAYTSEGGRHSSGRVRLG